MLDEWGAVHYAVVLVAASVLTLVYACCFTSFISHFICRRLQPFLSRFSKQQADRVPVLSVESGGELLWISKRQGRSCVEPVLEGSYGSVTRATEKESVYQPA